MRRTLLKSKIHRAVTTGGDLEYSGSVSVDPLLLEAADIVRHERVDVYNIDNGNRFSTYAISGEPGSGEIGFNGAAAHLAKRGDRVIICSYAEYEEVELGEHEGIVVLVDEDNRITEVVRTATIDDEAADGSRRTALDARRGWTDRSDAHPRRGERAQT